MRPKPKGLSPEYGAQFGDAAIVAAYPSRPPYTEGVFSTLTDLIGNGPRTVLDLGCGTGDLARRLAPLVERVDAVDLSAGMIALGKTLPGGDVSNLRWIAGAAEDAPLAPPYGLVTAGESLHWMAWDVVLPRLRESLTPGGMLAVVERGEAPSLWWDDLIALIARYSTNRDFQPYDVIDELTERGLFAEKGRRALTEEPYDQSVVYYVESIHSRNGFSRDRMPADDAAAFDDAVRTLLSPYARDGMLHLGVTADVVWGEPAPR